MREKTIALVCCTAKSSAKDTLLYQSIAEQSVDDVYAVFDYCHYYESNKEGLSKRYNEFLETHIDDYDMIVFVHDDVYLDDGRVRQKLAIAHEQFDIVGVAGGVAPVIREPALWHIMCGGFGPNLRGFAGHYVSDKTVSVTNFGPTPARVAIADGVFLSVKTEAIKRTNWLFNENFTFHHYDIASCLDANKKKLKIGVWPILLFHMSPGLRSLDDVTFLENQAKFINEYRNY
jgi:hypothetical protein